MVETAPGRTELDKLVTGTGEELLDVNTLQVMDELVGLSAGERKTYLAALDSIYKRIVGASDTVDDMLRTYAASLEKWYDKDLPEEATIEEWGATCVKNVLVCAKKEDKRECSQQQLSQLVTVYNYVKCELLTSFTKKEALYEDIENNAAQLYFIGRNGRIASVSLDLEKYSYNCPDYEDKSIDEIVDRDLAGLKRDKFNVYVITSESAVLKDEEIQEWYIRTTESKYIDAHRRLNFDEKLKDKILEATIVHNLGTWQALMPHLEIDSEDFTSVFPGIAAKKSDGGMEVA